MHLVAWLGVLVLALLAAACGEATDADSAAGDRTADGEPVTLTYWTFSDFTVGKAGELQRELIAKFESENPGIEVELVGKTGSDIVSGIAASAGQSSGPDVVTVQLAAGGPLVAAGTLLDLASYWNAEPDEYRTQFSEPFVEALKTDDAVLGVPYTSYSTILYRNLTVLEDAGIDPEEGIRDWAHWIEQMKTVHESGNFAIANPFVTYWEAMSYYGGIPDTTFAIADDGTTTLGADAFAEALSFMQSRLPDAASVAAGDQAETDLFISNELAFVVSGPWLDPTLVEAANQADLEYDFIPVPGATGDQAGGTRGGEFLGVTASSQHPDEAWKFIRFVADVEQAAHFAVGLGRTVANDAAMASPAAEEVPLLQVTTTAFADAVDESPLMSNVPNQAFDHLNNAVTAAKGGDDAEAVSEAAVAKFNEAVEQTIQD